MVLGHFDREYGRVAVGHGILTVFFGLTGLTVLLFMALPQASSPMSNICDGKQMNPGDRCVELVNGVPQSTTYYGEINPGHGFDLVAFLVAMGLLLIATVFGTLSARSARRYRGR